MERKIDGLFHYNENQYEWQRTDRIQHYKNAVIYSITAHWDGINRNHRYYEIVQGEKTWTVSMNKKGGNMETVKDMIDSAFVK